MSTLTTKKRPTFWISPNKSEADLQWAEILSTHGYQVSFFRTLTDFMQALNSGRPGIVVVSNDGPPEQIEEILSGLLNITDIAAAKMIMVTSATHGSENAKFLAACGHFRDIIPADLALDLFVSRFRFATANSSTIIPPLLSPLSPLSPIPGKVTIESPCKVLLPCRVTSISSAHLTIECRFKPKIGDQLRFSGRLARLLTSKSLGLTVENTYTTGLAYRFSEGFVAKWDSLDIEPSKIDALLKIAADEDPGMRLRIFIAVGNASLRTKLILALEHPKFLVATALQRHGMVMEPRFFGPNIIMIDDELALSDQGKLLNEMLENAPQHCKTYVIGSKWSKVLAQCNPAHLPAIQGIDQLPPEQLLTGLGAMLEHERKNLSPKVKQAISIASESPLSFGEVIIKGQLTGIHPQYLEIRAHHEISNFGLARIVAPPITQALGRRAYIKFVANQYIAPIGTPSEAQPLLAYWSYDAVFSDLTTKETEKFARVCVETLQYNYKKQGLPDIFLTEPHQSARQQVLSIISDLEHQEKTTTSPPTPRNKAIKMGHEALKGVIDTLEGHETHGFVRSLTPILLIGGVVILLIWGVFTLMSHNLSPSGSVYSDQLKNFNP